MLIYELLQAEQKKLRGYIYNSYYKNDLISLKKYK